MADRLLFVLHHYAGDRPEWAPAYHSARADRRAHRVASLTACLDGIWETFGGPRSSMAFEGGRLSFDPLPTRWEVEVVVCVWRDHHVLADLKVPPSRFTVARYDGLDDPIRLGFACHHEIAGRAGGFDFCCHLEDDTLLSDPLFFDKLRHFNAHAGPASVLVPHRFEAAGGRTCLVDGRVGDVNLGAAVRDIPLPVLGGEVVCRRPANPYSGCYFLDRPQVARLLASGHYPGADASWIGPLESGMSLPLMRAFAVYKPPAESGFLEVRHHGDRYVGAVPGE